MVAQRWRLVTFVHWAVEPAVLARVIPEPLEVDTYDGRAWVSLVAFSTTCEVAGVVPVPGPRRFPETNLRTYVRGPDGRDGLYFFSLDVENRANAVFGRFARLEYHVSDMTIDDGSSLGYTGRRRGSEDVAYDVVVEWGAPKRADDLDIFLTGRWAAYVAYAGAVVRYDAQHERWPLHDAHVVRCEQTLTDAAGFDVGAAALAHFAPGVSARLAPGRASCARPRSPRS
jgi:uncharacterized protein YqjF (DUF2071 family)